MVKIKNCSNSELKAYLNAYEKLMKSAEAKEEYGEKIKLIKKALTQRSLLGQNKEDQTASHKKSIWKKLGSRK